MSSLVILFVAIVAVAGPNNVMGSISAQEIDLDKLLGELAQQQRSNRGESSESSESDDSDESDTSSLEDLARAGRVSGDSLMDIISQVVNSKNKPVNSKRKNRKERASHEPIQRYGIQSNKYENFQRNDNVAQILEQLFSNKDLKEEPRWRSSDKVSKKRLTPNRLLGDVINRNDDGLEDYSKIYILLNPQAIQKSKDNKSVVNKLISKILSLSSPPIKKEKTKSKQRRYKGFAIKGDIGRRRGSGENVEDIRKSNSVYAPKDSIEDKPKRSRGNGGGGGAGHTAIPYIKHRGDNIYERDN